MFHFILIQPVCDVEETQGSERRAECDRISQIKEKVKDKAKPKLFPLSRTVPNKVVP